MRKPRFDYLKCQTHILLDMHVPQWDEGFLAKFDSAKMVDIYQRTGTDAVMHYCNSHVGLNYWPSSVGEMHRGLEGRDMVADTLKELHARGIASCAYYSSYFNNWAWTNHPEWRIVEPGTGGLFGPQSRYGICCPNNPSYHEFQRTQVDELARIYAFDAFFFDMVFWPQICLCEHCQTRFRKEEAADIPTVVDWGSPTWTAFTAARERWLGSAFRDLVETVKRHADIPVFNNVGCIDKTWQQGFGWSSIETQDVLGGDFGVLGNDIFAGSHLISRMTPSVLQYMNNLTGSIGSSTYMLEPGEQFGQHALVSLLFSGQFMAIDTIEPDGTVGLGLYDSLKDVFKRMAPYKPFLGGKPKLDVAIYFNTASRISLEENGAVIGSLTSFRGEQPPHMRALRGAVHALRLNHVPSGVITEREISQLHDYPVIVLPNVVRMGDHEIAAFRQYVSDGGCLYASGHTSRVSPDGNIRNDFALADLFGCHYEATPIRLVAFVRPSHPLLKEAIYPRRAIAHGSGRDKVRTRELTSLTIRSDNDTEVLATLDLPFGKAHGTRENEEWSSIHASPPYVATNQPAVLLKKFGKGRVIYSAMDIESNRTPARAAQPEPDHGPAKLFVGLIKMLLRDTAPTFELAADTGVTAVAFDDKAEGRIRLHIANLPPTPPVRPAPRVGVVIRAPKGHRISGVGILPGDRPLAHHIEPDGSAHIELTNFEDFVVIAASYR